VLTVSAKAILRKKGDVRGRVSPLPQNIDCAFSGDVRSRYMECVASACSDLSSLQAHRRQAVGARDGQAFMRRAAWLVAQRKPPLREITDAELTSEMCTKRARIARRSWTATSSRRIWTCSFCVCRPTLIASGISQIRYNLIANLRGPLRTRSLTLGLLN
jgi:hypothetical protein